MMVALFLRSVESLSLLYSLSVCSLLVLRMRSLYVGSPTNVDLGQIVATWWGRSVDAFLIELYNRQRVQVGYVSFDVTCDRSLTPPDLHARA